MSPLVMILIFVSTVRVPPLPTSTSYSTVQFLVSLYVSDLPNITISYSTVLVLYYSTTERQRPSLHQASVKKGGPRGVSPLVRSGGGLKNRRFPPPHPSHDNVLYSIFAPCLVRALL